MKHGPGLTEVTGYGIVTHQLPGIRHPEPPFRYSQPLHSDYLALRRAITSHAKTVEMFNWSSSHLPISVAQDRLNSDDRARRLRQFSMVKWVIVMNT
jgi:hypothetical protein